MFIFVVEKDTMHPAGKFLFTCPGCGNKDVFFLYQQHSECVVCGEPFPDMKKIATTRSTDLDYFYKKGAK